MTFINLVVRISTDMECYTCTGVLDDDSYLQNRLTCKGPRHVCPSDQPNCIYSMTKNATQNPGAVFLSKGYVFYLYHWGGKIHEIFPLTLFFLQNIPTRSKKFDFLVEIKFPIPTLILTHSNSCSHSWRGAFQLHFPIHPTLTISWLLY